MMKRTLYLNESDRNIHISLDGPSLLIKSSPAERRIPIRLISRVIVFGNIVIESNVLTFLAEQSIPVLFVSKWVKSESISLPLNYGMLSRCINLELVARDPSKSEDFVNWARQMRAYLEIRVIKSLYPNYYGIDNSNYRKIISFYMPENKEQWSKVKILLKPLFFSYVLNKIINAHLDPHCGIMHKRCAFGLLKDFLYILHPESDLQALQFFKSDSIGALIEDRYNSNLLTARGVHNIVHRFENRQYIVHEISTKILDKIFELMDKKNGNELSRML